MNSNLSYRICTRCVMDTSDPQISFDIEGHCNHCRAFFERRSALEHGGYDSERAWESHVREIKSRSKFARYDCVVGVSGGVDSSYVALLCKQYSLRVLMVHVDNGWNSEIASRNIRRLVDELKFDYMSVVINWKEFREVQLAFLRSGSVDLEMPTDIAIYASLVHTAVKNGIRYIISGGNVSSEGMLPIAWGYHRYKDMRYYRYIVKKYSKANLKDIPTIGLWSEGFYRLLDRFRVFYILNFHRYDRNSAKRELENRVGWQDYGGKHHESRITAFWQGYVMKEKFGFDYRRPTFSAEICSGLMSRDNALLQLDLPAFDSEFVLRQELYIAKKFRLDLESFRALLASPPKSYFDFPNQKGFIDLFYNFYRKWLS